jgi:hypothetical protein
VASVDRFPYSSSVGGDVLHLVSEKRLVFFRIKSWPARTLSACC